MRPSADDLAAAVAAGVIDQAAADRLRAFLTRDDEGPSPLGAADREDVRFVRGFHDVFMSFGLAALLIGFRLAVMAVIPGSAHAAAFALGASAIWALAEIFARRQRLVLPSIVLALGFVTYVATAATFVFGAFEYAPGTAPDAAPFFAVAGAALAAAIAFRLRFRLPFSSLLIAGGVIGLGLAALETVAPGAVEAHWDGVLLGLGLAVFAVAMRYDLKDPGRVTLAADHAFWLHLLAAPMIVHALLAFAVAKPDAPTGPEAGLVVAIMLALALIALAIDRRALLMSGLIYFGAAIGVLVAQTDIDPGAIFALTLVLLGGFVVTLGAGWRPARRLVLAGVPSAARRALPPVR
ncbi:hypothetical protein JOD31_002048 [Methylopila capsulata]|uniref:DUF2157 domain-containing protein n=1 Tax=Methylopila capsulata TaxID=61654 RepID=A0A9W6IQY0_9HYPH|nr:hypothetical protein [Methylopila capsulata]MBM7851823.1 hypothetical protein [Methylopila capsulata]GLK54887.1 hypothetical protein GCM10008170_09060 [Methylopila capsulata]